MAGAGIADFGACVKDTVVFVSLTTGLGGPTRSLATVLSHVDSIRRILAAPPGAFSTMASERGLADQHVRLSRWRKLSRASRLMVALQLILWIGRNRSRVLAVHANGQAELNVVAPAAVFFRTPVVMWAHASVPSPSARALGVVWRRVLPRFQAVAVSDDAREVLLESGLVMSNSEIRIVPNPIDPADVVSSERTHHEGINVGFLRGRAPSTGYEMLPDVVQLLDGLPVKWLVFSSPPQPDAPAAQHAVWERLLPFVGDRVEVRGKIPRVDTAYAECDIVFSPSLRESFGRVVAEAMLNGIPVVASDIPPFRRLLGNNEAGLLFPLNDATAAARCIAQLAADSDLRRRLGSRGIERAQAYLPGPIVAVLGSLYDGSRDAE